MTSLLTRPSQPTTSEEEYDLHLQYFMEMFPELTEEEIRETIHVIDAIYGDEEDPVEV